MDQHIAIEIPYGYVHHIIGALGNQAMHLYRHPGDSLSRQPLQRESIRQLKIAAQKQDASSTVSLDPSDTIHAIEGVRRMAVFYQHEADKNPQDIGGLAAKRQAANLRGLSRLLVEQFAEDYRMSPATLHILRESDITEEVRL